MSNICNPDNESLLKGNGNYHLPYRFTTISVKWETPSITPAGVLTFTVDGDALAGDNTLDLGAGERVINCSGYLSFVDVEVSGLPAGGAVTLYLS